MHLVALALAAAFAASCAGEKKKKECPPEQRLEGDACVDRCDADSTWRDGECVATAAALLVRLEAAQKDYCGCKDDACRDKRQKDFDVIETAVRGQRTVKTDAEAERIDVIAGALEQCKQATETPLLQTLSKLRDGMCQCKDVKCAGIFDARFSRLMKTPAGLAASKGKDPEVLEISRAITKCLNAAMN